MKATLKGACRGDGRAYLKVVLDERIAKEHLTVRAVLGGSNTVPCEWGIMPDGAADATEIVVVCPLWESGALTVAVAKSGEAGVGEASVALDGRALRWESRINYRLRKDLAWGMREFGDSLPERPVEVCFEDAIEDGAELYFRGLARFAQGRGEDCAFSCLDEQGSPIPCNAVVLGNDVRLARPYSAALVHDVRFSLRMPRDVGAFTLVVEGASGSGARGFYTVLPSIRSVFVERGLHKVTDASKDAGYPAWLAEHAATAEKLEAQRALHEAQGDAACSFSVVVDACGATSDDVARTLSSLKAQSDCRWSAVVVDAVADAEGVEPVPVEADILFAPSLGAVSNDLAEWVVFVGAGDALEPDALHELACAVEADGGLDALYVDDDRLVGDGSRAVPFFKPDFSIDLLRSYNYIGSLLCVRRQIALDAVLASFSGGESANAYRRVLRAAELTQAIGHMPRVLYHRLAVASGAEGPIALREGQADEGADDALQAVRDHFGRLGIQAAVQPAPWSGVQHVRYAVQGDPLVSIVIPNKDCSAMLDDCIRSIVDKTTYRNFEIVVVENNSSESDTFAYYETVQRELDCVRVVKWPGEFNFSKIVNFGASQARGDYLLLLNNDTEVIAGEWLECMLGACQRPNVGAVGARLLFRDGSIQHAGALITDEFSGAHHAFMHLPGSFPGYFLFGSVTRDVSIVSAACMLTSREAFDTVGGFEEELTVAYNDVDYCLKVREAGFTIVYEPAAELYHYESVSRGYDALDEGKRARLFREEAYMHCKWAAFYLTGDPLFNPNLEYFYYRLKR